MNEPLLSLFADEDAALRQATRRASSSGPFGRVTLLFLRRADGGYLLDAGDGSG